MGIFFILSMSCFIFFPTISATFPLPVVFRCCAKLFVLRLIPHIFTLCIALKTLCNFLLNTWISLLTFRRLTSTIVDVPHL
jgi:hypothetical protein